MDRFTALPEDLHPDVNLLVGHVEEARDNPDRVAEVLDLVVERLQVVSVGESLLSSAPPSAANQWYRATAEGYGRSENAKAMVQSVYRK